ncbi:MAG: flagellar hook-basal body complex protein FliE [Chitinivibrionales bacterium]|nr:flagellar hook-basal body complex protein FliE [Chitinivibrionales bacterium]MBD3358113.1 flagellar hook-basal body complex protein FliE [Chitinivibrionales bacterium]
MNQINPIGPSKGPHEIGKSAQPKGPAKGQPSFKETLGGFLKDVNDMQVKADKSIAKLVSGEITDVHQVMNSAQEAGVAFNMMMEIRNKVMDAYQEVMRLRL